jgi:fibronectin-binding autotransporter adhesin
MKTFALRVMFGFVALSASAAPLVWDADTGTAGPQDGSGDWNTTAPTWWDGGANVTWNNATPDAAAFGAGSGTGVVTLTEGISHGGIAFNTNYTVTGLTLTNVGSPAISVADGASATISSILAGSGFSKAGAGTLSINSLASANTYTGSIAVQNGTLEIQGFGADGTIRGPVTVAAGARLRQLSNNIIENNAPITVEAGGVYDFNSRAEFMAGPAGAGTVTNVNSNDRGNTFVVATGSNTFDGTMHGNGVWEMAGGAYWKVAGNILGGSAPWISEGATLELSGNNSFGVSTWFARIGNNVNPGGSGTVVVSGGVTTNNATLWIGHFETNQGGTLTIRNASWVQNGAIEMARGNADGTVNLQSGGELDINNNIAKTVAGLGVAAINLDGGTLKQRGGTVSVPIVVTANGGTISNNNTAISNLNGPLTNNGALMVTAPLQAAPFNSITVNGVFSGNAPLFNGYIILQGAGAWTGDTVVTNAPVSAFVMINTNETIPDASVLRFAGGQVALNNDNGAHPRTETVKALDGAPGVLTTTRTGNKLITGAFDGSGAYGGTIVPHSVGGDLQIVKIGTGTQELNGAITCANSYIADGGVLSIGANDSIRGPTTINAGGTFRLAAARCFNGLSAAYTIGISNGTLDVVGAENNVGKITFLNGGQSTGPGLTYVRYGFESLASASTAVLGHANIQLVSDQVGNQPIVFAAADGAASIDLLVTSRVGRIGGLRKTGAGKMALTDSANGYSGSTFIDAGVLALVGDGAITASTNFRVAAGATLDVSGRNDGTFVLGAGLTLSGHGTVTGIVAAAAGATIAPGDFGTAGTLSCANSLSLSNGSVLRFDLDETNGVGGGTNDLIEVAGDLSLDGVVTADLRFLDAAPAAFPATYTVLRYGGTRTGGEANLTNAPSRFIWTFSIDETNKAVLATMTGGGPESVVWRGDGVSNVWDVSTTTNWLNGIDPDVFFQNDSVTFDDSGSNTPAVSLAADLQPASVLVSASNDYTFAGPGFLSGLGGIVKTGPGKLTLSNANAYAGATTIHGGTVAVARAGALGATNGGTVVHAGGALDINGISLGDEPVVLSGGAAANYGATPVAGIRFLDVVSNSTIGGTTRFDIRVAGGHADLGGNTLTKTGANYIAFVFLPVSNGVLDVAEGTVSFHGAGTATRDDLTVNVLAGATNEIANFGGGPDLRHRLALRGGTLVSPNASGGITFHGPVDVQADSTVYVDDGDNLTVTNVIGGPGRITVTANNANGCLVVAGAASNQGSFAVASGTLRIGGGGVAGSVVGPITNDSVVDFFRADGFTLTNALAGTGSLYVNVAGGLTANASAPVDLGGSIEVPHGAVGSLTVDPGASVSAGRILLGNTAGFPGSVLQRGGTVSAVASDTTKVLGIGHYSNEVSTYVMGGGTLNVPSGPIDVGSDGIGLFIVTGGVVNARGLRIDGNVDTPAVGGTSETFALEGGRVNLGLDGVTSASTDGVYRVLLGGGTLSALDGWASDVRMTLTGTNGSAVVDSAGFNIAFFGVLEGPGGLRKTGAGMLSMEASNVYAGVTEIEGGTLQLNGSIAGDATVAAGGTLGGVGVVEGALVCSGGLAPGASAGKLTVRSGVMLQGGSSLRVELGGTTPEIEYDVLVGEGSVALAGNLQVLFIDGFESAVAPGDIFTVLRAAEPISGSFANVAPGGSLTSGAQAFKVYYGSAPFGGDNTVVVLEAISAVVDSDGDGLSDDDEDSIYGTDKNDADSDNDGMNDGDEVVAGSNPLDAGSIGYRVIQERKVGGAVAILWSSTSNRTYDVLSSTNLLGAQNWTPVSTVPSGGATTGYTNAAPGSAGVYQIKARLP